MGFADAQRSSAEANAERRKQDAVRARAVRQALLGQGFKAENRPSDPTFIVIDLERGERRPELFVMEPYLTGAGHYCRGELAGWHVRYDYEGKRGMGTIRYPLRKDGTIDMERLRADIDSWDKRERSREDIEEARNRRKREASSDYDRIEERAACMSGASGCGLYIETDLDGSAEGKPVRIKISGHVSVARAEALLKALEDTKEQ